MLYLYLSNPNPQLKRIWEALEGASEARKPVSLPTLP